MPQITVESPVGPLTLIETDGHLTRLTWKTPSDWNAAEPVENEPTPLLAEAARQLSAFFSGETLTFELPLKPAGTAFQQAVWDAMCKIPPGETQSYGELADAVGGVARAVGGACGANPIPIIIPCHRVLAAGGRMGGFSGSGGVETKRFLLAHEGALPKELF